MCQVDFSEEIWSSFFLFGVFNKYIFNDTDSGLESTAAFVHVWRGSRVLNVSFF